MQEFDTVVVGLGAMGSAAICQLARAGSRTLGIDRFSPPHKRGSSHGDTRITRVANGEGAHYTPMVRRSHEIWRDIERETGAELLTVTGGLIVSSRFSTAHMHVPLFFQNTLASAKAFGIAHEVLDAASLRKRFPQFRVEDDEQGYFERDAGFLRVEACLSSQLRLAQKHGAEIHTGETVTRLVRSDGGVIVETDRAHYRGKTAIVCVGAWIPEFAGRRHSDVFRIFRQSVHWFEIDGAHESFVPGRFPIFIWEIRKTGKTIYGFPAVDGANGGIKIATERYDEATFADSTDPGANDAAEFHRDLIAGQIPGVSARCLRAETCFYTVTPDAGFVIDKHPELENVILVSACSGHGFKHSPAIGEALAQWVTGGKTRLDLAPFRLDRFGP